MNGYRRRNFDIANILEENDDRVVIISDIQKFYPSINKEILLARLSEKLGSTSLSRKVQNVILNNTNVLHELIPGEQGI